jgi:hypothetical protein
MTCIALPFLRDSNLRFLQDRFQAPEHDRERFAIIDNTRLRLFALLNTCNEVLQNWKATLPNRLVGQKLSRFLPRYFQAD